MYERAILVRNVNSSFNNICIKQIFLILQFSIQNLSFFFFKTRKCSLIIIIKSDNNYLGPPKPEYSE
jgi:hypothetical protein